MDIKNLMKKEEILEILNNGYNYNNKEELLNDYSIEDFSDQEIQSILDMNIINVNFSDADYEGYESTYITLNYNDEIYKITIGKDRRGFGDLKLLNIE